MQAKYLLKQYYNKQINIMNKIHNDIIFINLENINDMYLELLEYFSKKN